MYPTDLILEKIINIVTSAIEGVKAIYLFGSYADGTMRDDSDMDICVHVPGGISGGDKLKLMSSFVKDVAISVDLVDFKNCSTLFQFEVVTKGRLIYDGDTCYNDNTYLKTLGIYYDHVIETREIIEDIKKNRQVYG